MTQDFYSGVTNQKPSTCTGDRLPVETVSWKIMCFFCNKPSIETGPNPFYIVQTENEDYWKNKNTISIDGYETKIG
ncbi:hypothetical protein DHD05_13325 [Arenibacter sp. N53]|nr:hypothetical protein [Arenibacter sp. N53]